MNALINKFYRVLSSKKLFPIILGFFAFEAIWIALSASYPQAFDESFHFGLIQIYSHHWLPFISSQPPNANAYGAVARDPSYLYHYLMSFPYRIIALFFHEQVGQVIMLRFINIGLFGIGLILLRKVLLRVKISVPLANLSIFLFVLIPIVPQLAAQINYDNMLIPLVAWVVLLTFDLTDQIKKHQPSARKIMTILIVCLFTSLVKYAFLPIFLAVLIYFGIISYKYYHGKYKKLFRSIYKSWLSLTLKLKIILILLSLLSFGMFVQRDVVNVIKYHNVEPDCAAVLTVKQCSAYSAWYYSYSNHQSIVVAKSNGTVKYINPFVYLFQWTYWMWYRLFFAVNGPSVFTNYPPMPLPAATAIVVAVLGIICVIRWWRKIFENNIYLFLLFLVSLVYILVLIGQGFSAYHYTGVLINMNGRYLLPVLPFLIAIIGKAFSIALRNFKATRSVIAILIVFLFLQGGGVFTFISRSDDTWDFQNHTVQKVNDTTRKILNPVIVKGNKTYYTSQWFFN